MGVFSIPIRNKKRKSAKNKRGKIFACIFASKYNTSRKFNFYAINLLKLSVFFVIFDKPASETFRKVIFVLRKYLILKSF